MWWFLSCPAPLPKDGPGCNSSKRPPLGLAATASPPVKPSLFGLWKVVFWTWNRAVSLVLWCSMMFYDVLWMWISGVWYIHYRRDLCQRTLKNWGCLTFEICDLGVFLLCSGKIGPGSCLGKGSLRRLDAYFLDRYGEVHFCTYIYIYVYIERARERYTYMVITWTDDWQCNYCAHSYKSIRKEYTVRLVRLV